MSTDDVQHYNGILTNELWTENDEHNILLSYTCIRRVLQFLLLKLKKKQWTYYLKFFYYGKYVWCINIFFVYRYLFSTTT